MSQGGSPVSSASTSGASSQIGAPAGATLHTLVRSGRAFSGHEQNCSFLNLGNGKFADISANSGFDFDDDGRAIGRCDWDGDGDLDFWIANRSGPQVRFLQNELQTGNHFLNLSLVGKTCNRDAVGARVEVLLADEANTKLIKTLHAGEAFLSQSSKLIHFGLGKHDQAAEVLVWWPGGERESFGALRSDQHYSLVQSSGEAKPLARPARTLHLKPQPLSEPAGTDLARVVSGSRIPLPTLPYESFQNELQLLEMSQRDRPMLVNLWATWCRACLIELKGFAVQAEALQSAGVDVLALSVDKLDPDQPSSAQSPEEVLRELGYLGEAGYATEQTAELLQMTQQHLFDLHLPPTLPTSLLLNSQGEIAVIYRGPVEVEQLLADVAKLESLVESDAVPLVGRWHSRRQRLSPLDLVWQLVEAGYTDVGKDYITRHLPLLKSHYNLPKLLVLVGNNELAEAETKSAIAYYTAALKLDVNYGEAQNNLAWILATCPDEKVRDGRQALQLASAAVRQQRGDLVSMLDTLAAAFAENGQFDKAVQAVNQAVALANQAGQTERAARIDARRKLYDEGKPFRDE